MPSPQFLQHCGIDGKPHGLEDIDRQQFAPAHGGKRVLEVLVTQSWHRRSHFLLDENPLHLGQHLLDDLAAQPRELLSRGGPGGAADRGPGLAGDRQSLPGGGRRLGFGTDDIDLVAILQFGDQRRMAAIDLGAHAAIAHRSVNGIGKIDGRGSLGQGYELALWGKTEHLIMKQFKLRVLEEFARGFALLQHFHQMPEPAVGVRFRRRRPEAVERFLGVGRVLVHRVRGHAPLGDLVHQPCPDLHFDAHVMRTDHRRMDRPVVVLLRRRDIILEAARNRPVGAVDDAQRAITLVDGADHHPESENVGELTQRQKFPLHLAEDRVRPLLAPVDFRLDAVFGQLLRYFLFDRRQDATAFGMQLGEPVGDDAVGLRVQGLEGNVLKLVAQRLHAHAAGQWRVDFHRLLGDSQPLLGLHMIERPHVVQPVGELDQQHPHVLGHRQQQFPQIFGLGGFLGDQVELGDLGQPIDQRGDLAAEFFLDFLVGCLGILHRIVKQRRGDRRGIELHFGEDRGHFERMVEISLAGRAFLVAVRLHRIDIGAVEKILIRVGIILRDPLHQFVLPHHRVSVRQKRPDTSPALIILDASRLSSRCAGCPGFRLAACLRGRGEGLPRSSAPFPAGPDRPLDH